MRGQFFGPEDASIEVSLCSLTGSKVVALYDYIRILFLVIE